MAPHSSTLAWKIPWMEEPGRLQSMGSLRVEHDWATSFSLFTFMYWRRKWQPSPVSLPGKSHGQRRLAGSSPQGHKELDPTERRHLHSHILCYGTWRRPFFSFKHSHFLSFILCRISVLEQTNWYHITGNSKQRLRNHNRSFWIFLKRKTGSLEVSMGPVFTQNDAQWKMSTLKPAPGALKTVLGLFWKTLWNPEELTGIL